MMPPSRVCLIAHFQKIYGSLNDGPAIRHNCIVMLKVRILMGAICVLIASKTLDVV